MKFKALFYFVIFTLGFVHFSFSKSSTDIDAQIKEQNQYSEEIRVQEELVEQLRENAKSAKIEKKQEVFKDYAEAQTRLKEMKFKVPQN